MSRAQTTAIWGPALHAAQPGRDKGEKLEDVTAQKEKEFNVDEELEVPWKSLTEFELSKSLDFEKLYTALKIWYYCNIFH